MKGVKNKWIWLISPIYFVGFIGGKLPVWWDIIPWGIAFCYIVFLSKKILKEIEGDRRETN